MNNNSNTDELLEKLTTANNLLAELTKKYYSEPIDTAILEIGDEDISGGYNQAMRDKQIRDYFSTPHNEDKIETLKKMQNCCTILIETKEELKNLL